MTLFHFINCLIVVYVPHYLAYKYSGLPEYRAFWKCAQAGGVYLLTQLAKMMMLATFCPTYEGSVQYESNFEIVGEFLKSSVDLIDLLGICFVLIKIVGRSEARVLTTAIGWSTAEFMLMKLLVLWFEARGIEFSWRHLQNSFDTNINLIHYVALTALVAAWMKTNIPKGLVPVILALIFILNYKQFVVDILAISLNLEQWKALVAKLILTLFIGFATLQVYIGARVEV